MPHKGVWETRYEELEGSIKSHRESNLEALGRMALANRTSNDTLDTREYWELVGKAEVLDQLSKSARVWSRL